MQQGEAQGSPAGAQRLDRGQPPGMPRWVKVSGTIVVLAFLAFLAWHLASGGLGGHA